MSAFIELVLTRVYEALTAGDISRKANVTHGVRMKHCLCLLGILFCACAVSATEDPSGTAIGTTQGFPPLAVETFNISADKIPALRETLKKFAAVEHLTYLEAGFPKQGRQVSQFYLKKDSRPAFYIDNFRDPLKFEATAYSRDSEAVWTPRWLRLLGSIRSISAGD
jgi:hypothetical protein